MFVFRGYLSRVKKVKREFLCKVKENEDVFGVKLAAKTLNLKCHLERYHVDIFKRVVETDEVETSQTTASNAVCIKKKRCQFFPVKKLLCQ